MIALGFLLLIVGAGLFAAVKRKDGSLGSIMVVALILGTIFPVIIGSFTELKVKYANSDNYVAQFKEELKNEGFQFVTGSPQLSPNNISSMMLSYEGENFDCTLFTPENIDLNIIISCGETKLTLTQIKQETK